MKALSMELSSSSPSHLALSFHCSSSQLSKMADQDPFIVSGIATDIVVQSIHVHVASRCTEKVTAWISHQEVNDKKENNVDQQDNHRAEESSSEAPSAQSNEKQTSLAASNKAETRKVGDSDIEAFLDTYFI
jgi:hypothetical protein